MTTLLAILEFTDYAAIATIVVIFAGGAAFATRPDENVRVLSRQMRELQRKLDALLKHEGIELPQAASGLSRELERLASDPSTKIAAIKLYREEKPGTGLAEAKEAIETFYRNKQ